MAKRLFHIELNQQLLIIRPKGAWSEETARKFVAQSNLFHQLYDEGFAGLIDLRQWELGTPEALGVLAQHLLDSINLGYRLEFHFGEPRALPLMVSEKSITPDNLTLIQTHNVEEIENKCREFGYAFERDALHAFLELT